MLSFDTALLDVSQMNEADRLTVAAGTPICELMERAGQAVAEEIQRRWSLRPTLVLCGPGNNGGDGFVAARILAAAGWPVRIALSVPRDALKGAAKTQAERWQGPLAPMQPELCEGAQLIVDAIFGSGLGRPISGEAAATLAEVARRKTPVIAVDVPSGVMGDTGENLGAIEAAVTVTFLRKKPGHLLLPGRLFCGEVVVADIGTVAGALAQIAPNSFENSPSLWLGSMPWPEASGNKYTRGHALVSGGYPITGAARMSARAAARSGAGLTTIAVDEVAFPIYATAVTSVMIHRLTKADDFTHLLTDPRFSALLIGPGAGTGEETRGRVVAMLKTKRATVIDADAITAFEKDRARLENSIAGPCVMTPHDGEFARLFDPSGDKLTRARKAASQSKAVIVLKGADTAIVDPDGRAIINSNGPPTLATAGSGDVLSGIVVGLLAQHMDPFLAAAAAVWMHGAAASEFGLGLLAEDLPDLLPIISQRLYAQHHSAECLQDERDRFRPARGVS